MKGVSIMILTELTIIIALLFALNIGASGAAATMGPAYGGGAVRSRRFALCLVAVMAFGGAMLGSDKVIQTIGENILPSHILTVEVVLIILISSCLTLFMANILGIPLSTSEVTVGALVGVGIAFQSLFIEHTLFIVLFWFAIPLTALMIAFVLGKGLSWIDKRWPHLEAKNGKWRRPLIILLLLTGCIEAFAAGMNNVANAIGPIIGAGLVSEENGTWLGALFMALGAVLLGGKVLETNGKKITSLTLLQGSAVSGTGGILVLLASLFGIPVPLTQVTTSAIVGIGMADTGMQVWHKQIVQRIIKVWIASPIISLVVAYSLVRVFMMSDYTNAVLLCMCTILAFVGIVLLVKMAIRGNIQHQKKGEVQNETDEP
ncbi:inorganic phosphate transporter [Caldalkalibacillus salinus]|uniref:inorganic phosphate transporter n=1 Tax=Caldalkalibacillus salinus TaxID=2803787 RepID=UPI0030162FF1